MATSSLDSTNKLLKAPSIPAPLLLFVAFLAGGLYTGVLSKWFVGVMLSILLALVSMIVVFQESILYIPVLPSGEKTPAELPSGYQHPGQRNIPYEDVHITTPDGEKIHGWFIPAPHQRASSAPTLLFCHENAGNIGARMDEFQQLHRRLGINLLAFDYREYSIFYRPLTGSCLSRIQPFSATACPDAHGGAVFSASSQCSLLKHATTAFGSATACARDI